ncbi:MAG TPA: hypothetical protein PLI53_05515, partial [Geobacteraceae bacterium]|nr:hypothetical protein [Geobacteraceae bacterium]
HLESGGGLPVTVDKEAWIEMLRAAGMDDSAMGRWHCEFERRAPEAHHQFLLALGVSEDEAFYIRKRSREESELNHGSCREHSLRRTGIGQTGEEDGGKVGH